MPKPRQSSFGFGDDSEGYGAGAYPRPSAARSIPPTGGIDPPEGVTTPDAPPPPAPAPGRLPLRYGLDPKVEHLAPAAEARPDFDELEGPTG